MGTLHPTLNSLQFSKIFSFDNFFWIQECLKRLLNG